jgi:hypothetical protein
MASRKGNSGLSGARQDTASQLAAVVAALERMQAGSGAVASGARGGAGNEALTLLRQVVRLLTLIQSTQAASARLSVPTGGGVSGVSGGSGGGGIGGFFGRLLGVFSQGLGLASLALGVVNLFRGGSHQPTSQPIPYTAPESIALEVANTDQILRGFPRFDFSATGERRLIETAPEALAMLANTSESQAPAATAPVNITVNVSAMDSKSFQDHATELASAVRSAMLNLHPINQVVRDWY